jgi:hypothetical protein
MIRRDEIKTLIKNNWVGSAIFVDNDDEFFRVFLEDSSDQNA